MQIDPESLIFCFFTIAKSFDYKFIFSKKGLIVIISFASKK